MLMLEAFNFTLFGSDLFLFDLLLPRNYLISQSLYLRLIKFFVPLTLLFLLLNLVAIRCLRSNLASSLRILKSNVI
jgi:hypothetical protein